MHECQSLHHTVAAAANSTHLAVPYHQTPVHTTGAELGGISSHTGIHRYLTVVRKGQVENERKIMSKREVVCGRKGRSTSVRGVSTRYRRHCLRDGILMGGIKCDLFTSSTGPLVHSLELGHGTVPDQMGEWAV